MIAGRVDGAGVGVLAAVAGAVAGVTGLGVAAIGSVALGATTGGLDSTRGAGVAEIANVGDDEGGDAASFERNGRIHLEGCIGFK